MPAPALLEDVRVDPPTVPPYAPLDLWITATLAADLGEGQSIECQWPNRMMGDKLSPGRVKAIQADDPEGPHHVAIRVRRAGRGWEPLPLRIEPHDFDTPLRRSVRHGRRLFTEAPAGGLAAGTRIGFAFTNTTSPWIAGPGRVHLAVRGVRGVRGVGGERGGRVQPMPALEVVPGPAEHVHLYAPSAVRPGERFTLRIITLDQFFNLTRQRYEGVTLTRDDGTPAAEGLAFTGRGEFELSLDGPGVYRFHALGERSNPVRVCDDPRGPYWGDLHFHTNISADGIGDTPYEYAQRASCLDFACLTEHGNVYVANQWEQVQRWQREHDRPGTFAALLGFETNCHYHLNTYFRGTDEPCIDADESTGMVVSDERMAAFLQDKTCLTQLHHTGVEFAPADMTRPYFESTRLVEVYSHHGQSERYDPDHNQSYEHIHNLPDAFNYYNSIDGPMYARDAWALGRRLVTVASSDDHFGQPGKMHQGLAAVRCDPLTREAVYDALAAGACYGTTGDRILLDFEIDGRPMGSELTGIGGPLSVRIEVHGTAELGRVELCRHRFGRPIGEWEVAWRFLSGHRAYGGGGVDVLDLDERLDLEHVGPAVYYVRVQQRNVRANRFGVYAWSSPIWVDAPSFCETQDTPDAP